MNGSPPSRLPQNGGGDPWAAFGYLVAGVGGYGLLGWGLGVWLNISYLIAVGVVLGAISALVMIYYQYGRVSDSDATDQSHRNRDGSQAPPSHRRPDDDRGDNE